jgi:cold shock CspA family protein
MTEVHTEQAETGRIKYWNSERGFGFIEPSDTRKNDIFVHANGLPLDADDPEVGQKVSYVVGTRNGRPIALSIRYA